MRLVWRLLRQHISLLQLVGFFIANLIGVAIILCGVQIYNDVAPIFTDSSSLTANDFIVITKRVATDKMYNRGATRFSNEEIKELAQQPFVKRVGEFRSSQFKVRAEMAMLNAYTLMFFESVPDDFIDTKSEKWHFSEGDTTIPIIIPRDYLNLYNFGFSSSMAGLPQLSEELLQEIPLQITLTAHDGRTARYEAYIVGFSDRLNTILVPDSFLGWANKEYGHDAKSSANDAQCISRLIFEVYNPSDTAISEYLEEKGYHTEGNASASSKMSYLLKIALAIVVIIGGTFCLLSLSILTLSIYLLLHKNTTKLENLVLAGYTPRAVAAPYKVLTTLLNLSVLAGALAIAFVARHYYIEGLATIFDIKVSGTILTTILVGATITVVVIIFNAIIIQRKVNEISRKRM